MKKLIKDAREYDIKFEHYGDPDKPILICIHGLMGDEAIFASVNSNWSEHFHIIVPEITTGIDESNYILVDEKGNEMLWFEIAIDAMGNYLRENYPGQAAVFTGPSLGGKQILEVAGRYPELHLGSVLIDVGLGPLRTSKLFSFLENTLPNLNLKQPWETLRKEMREKITNRTMRIFAQKYIGYTPDNPNEAYWKGRVNDFVQMIAKSSTEDQFKYADVIQGPITILKASDFSAIADEDYERMKSVKNIEFIPVENSEHFMVTTHRDFYRDIVVEKLKPLVEKK